MLTPESFREILFSDCGYASGEPVLAAVSGGLDSIALCHLLQQHEIPFAIAHVNFGLRGKESDEDEQFVSELAKSRNVAFYLKRCTADDFSATGETSTQAVARTIRYAFFSQLAVTNGFQHIAVAHHADDAIETALLNFARGTGIAGLTGMKPRNGNVIRPLLPFTREQILLYATENNLQWREDSSNATDLYTRNRFRHHLLPWLMQEMPQAYDGFGASFGKLKETQQLLEAALQGWEEKCCTRLPNDELKISLHETQQFHRPELFLRFFLHLYGFSDAQLASLKQLLDGPSGTQLLSATHRLVRDREALFLVPLTATSNAENPLTVTKENFDGTFPDGKQAAVIDVQRVTEPLRVRRWEAGDKLIPLGMNGHRNVSDILNELKLPLHEKEKALVVVAGEEIVWVPGYRIAEKFRVTPETKVVLKMTWR